MKLDPSSADGYDIQAGNNREEVGDDKKRILLVRQTTMDPLGGGHLLKRGIYGGHDGHLYERTIDKIGGGHLAGRSIEKLNRLPNEGTENQKVGHIFGIARPVEKSGGGQRRGLFYDGDGHLGERVLQKLGGSYLPGRADENFGAFLRREPYRIGGGNLKRASHLDRLGGGGLLRRETHIDMLGGGHLLRREVGNNNNLVENDW